LEDTAANFITVTVILHVLITHNTSVVENNSISIKTKIRLTKIKN